eukprot:9366-Heterococcus_DN1.PRE.2
MTAGNVIHTSTCSHTSYNRFLEEATVTSVAQHCVTLSVAAESCAAVLTTPHTTAVCGITADANTAHYC